MNKAYDKVTWVNKPSTATPLNQTNLNKMSDALDIIDDRVVAMDTGKVSSVTVTNTLPTGDTIATITVDGTATNIKSAQITVDSEISTTSTNPVQNKVIAEALREVMPEVTVEGNPISITDGSNIVPAKLAEVTFLPKQDLHGYDNPWVGGAGKNKLQNTAKTATVNDVTFTVNSDGSVTANGTATANGYFIINSSITLEAGTYAINGCPSGGSGSSYYLYFYNSASSDFGNGSTATFDSETTITNTRIVFSSGQVFSNKVFYPMIRLASVTDSSFAPWENECPISGWTELNLNRCGKNIVNEVHHGNMNSNGSYGTGNTRVTNATSATSSVIKVKAGKYTISAVGLDYATILTKDNYNNIVDNFAGSWHALPYTFTITRTANLYFTARKSDNTTITLSDVSVQIEEGETATSYEAYQGHTYTESLGATYYGGKVDFVSGVVTIDRAIVNLGSLIHWTKGTGAGGTGTRFYTPDLVSDIKAPSVDTEIANAICSDYVMASSSDGYRFVVNPCVCVAPTGYVNIYDEQYADYTTTQFKNAMENVQFCYELTTPITLTLTPQEIELLKGANVLTTDGNSIKLVYSADIKAFIESQLQNS